MPNDRVLPSQPRKRRWWTLSWYALPVALVLVGCYRFLDFIQDDTFISLRYAAQLVAGHGLVFNPGERVEGFTNLSWTLIGAGALALHLPALTVLQVLGVASAAAAAVLTGLIADRLFGRLAGVATGCVVASSSILHCWAPSGLEMSFFAALLAGAVLAFTHDRRGWAFAVLGLAAWTRPEASLVALALGYASVGELFARSRGGQRRREVLSLGRDMLFFVIPALALIVFRRAYYGGWTPNTYLVKAGGDTAGHVLGLQRLGELAQLNGNLALWLCAALGVIVWGCTGAASGDATTSTTDGIARGWRRSIGCALRLAPGMFIALAADLYLHGPIFADNHATITSSAWIAQRHGAWGWLALSGLLGGALSVVLSWWPAVSSPRTRVLQAVGLTWLGYLYYFVRIGGDFLPLHRLYLPALPFQALLAVAAVAALWSAIEQRWAPRRQLAPLALGRLQGSVLGAGMLLGVWVCAQGLSYSLAQLNFATRTSLRRCHRQAGRDLQHIAVQHHFRPRVLAQDMGVMTFNSLDVDYVDAIGLTSHRIASILHHNDYSPYTRYLVWQSSAERRKIEAMEAELRALFSDEVAPDYVVAAADTTGQPPGAGDRAAARDDSAYFKRFIENNVFFYGWPRTPYFQQHYVFARAYPFSSTLYLVTYRRKDRPWLSDSQKVGGNPRRRRSSSPSM